MPTPSRVVIVVNPIAGGGTGAGKALETERLLTAAGCRVKHVVTEGPGDAERTAREAAADGADAVLVVGGDGTMNEALQGLAGSGTALAILPLGTANVLAHELGIGKGPKHAAELILEGERRTLDAGRANGRWFLCMASAGFDACVTEQMASLRRGAISYFSYIRPTWRAFWGYPFEPLRVKVDGVPLERPVYHLIVGNVRSYGGPFSMTPRAKADDGHLDACGFGRAGRAWLALYMAATVVRVHTHFGSVAYMCGSRIEVEADRPVPVQIDGDFKGYTPVTFEIVPQAVTVLANRR